MSRDRYKITTVDLPHFLTCTVVNWISIFTRPEAAEIIFSSMRYMQQIGQLRLYGYVLMENHVHMISSADDLSKRISTFKSYTARCIIDLLKERGEKSVLEQLSHAKLPHKRDRDYQFWQEGIHPILIQNEAMMRQKLEYMHGNPIRRGYVDEPAAWRYSSARNYSGLAGVLEVTLAW